jgi:Icc-related predicted phosphoesterase
VTFDLTTKILFTSDVHGSEPVFRKFVNSAKAYKVNHLILGGDITGKGFVSVSKDTAGTYRVNYMGREIAAKDDTEFATIRNRISRNGFYVYVNTPEVIEQLRTSKEETERVLKTCMRDTLTSWLNLAEERLKASGVKCYISPGNDDDYDIDEILNSSTYVINPEERVVTLEGGYEMITTGKANMTPWKCPRDVAEEELERTINGLTSQVKDFNKAIFNLHVPPYNTNLDIAPELDNTLTVVVKAGQLSMVHVGSVSVRKVIEKYQPMLGLHGHIHESKGVEKIGRCTCLNPGSEYQEGVLRGALITLDSGKLKSYQLTSG